MSDPSPLGGATLQPSDCSSQDQISLGQMHQLHHSPAPQPTHCSPELLLPPSSPLAIALTPQNSISQHPSEILRLPLLLPLTEQSEPAAFLAALMVPFSSAQSAEILLRPQVLGVSHLAPHTLTAMMPHLAPPLPATQQPTANPQEPRNHTAAHVSNNPTHLPLRPQPSQTEQPCQDATPLSTDELPKDTQITWLTTDTKAPVTEPLTSHDPLSQTQEQQPTQNQPASRSVGQDAQTASVPLYPSLPPAVVVVPTDPLRKLSGQDSVLEEGGVGLSLPKDASENEGGERTCHIAHICVAWSIFQCPKPE